MHPTIPINSVYVVSSNVIGNQVIRALEDMGFEPERIHPKVTLKIPKRAQLVVIVPKAVSHSATRAVNKWANIKEGKFVLYSNSGLDLKDRIIDLSLLAEAPDDYDLLKIHPDWFSTASKYIRALITADPTIDIDRFRKIEGFYSLGDRRGFSSTRYAKTVWQWRKDNGLPGLGPNKGRPPRPANWMPDETGTLSPSTRPVEYITHDEPEAPLKVSPPLPPADPPSKPVEPAQEHPGAAVAELVWEWMDRNGYESVTFFADGEVGARKKKITERVFVFHEMED